MSGSASAGSCMLGAVQFWGGQNSAAACGAVVVYLQSLLGLPAKGRVQTGFGGSGGASQWISMQKVVLSAQNQLQCFGLAPVLPPSPTKLGARVPVLQLSTI